MEDEPHSGGEGATVGFQASGGQVKGALGVPTPGYTRQCLTTRMVKQQNAISHCREAVTQHLVQIAATKVEGETGPARRIGCR